MIPKQSDAAPGYILLLTLMLLSIGVLLVTQISHRGMVHIHFDQTMIEREKAKQLALGGVQLAISKLSIQEKKEEPKGNQKEKEQKEDKQDFIKKWAPFINRWEVFTLKEEVDGIDGKVQFAISCEQGKIDINEFYDFKEHQFKGEKEKGGGNKKLMQELFARMKKFTNNKDLFASFEKFLKERTFPLNDPTELLSISDFQKVFLTDIFYQPPDKNSNKKPSIYLTDVFTTFCHTTTVQPWFLSDSLLEVLNLKRAGIDEIPKREKQIEQSLKEKNLKDTAQIWDKQLQPLYGKDFKSLPKEFQQIMDPLFEPTTFSVLSYGTFGAITQKIFAIIEKSSSAKKDDTPFVVKKLYWL